MAILKIKDGSQWTEVPALVGSPGISPTVTVTDITDGHRVTITDTNGAHNFDVMDGESSTLTAADKAEIVQQVMAEVDVPVQDVQVNGVSVLSDGVANVPVASSSNLGVIGLGSTTGTGLYLNPTSKRLFISPASESETRTGTNQYRPITSATVYSSAFYGLAKAAGADMASSSNPVGTYTDEAKIAIQKMLGVQNFNPQSIAIVANGDTHAAITSGQYVYVQNHSTLTEGLYAASSAIAANEALSASNLTAVESGGLNALLEKIPEQLVYLGTETNYPLSAAHTEYPIGITLIYTLSSTTYPYSMGTVITIRSAAARCLQLSFSNSPNDYKLRTADSDGWSDWKSLKDVPGITDLQKAIGIVVDGNKAATAVALGQFVILKNSTISDRTDGLYTAAKAIPANTAIDNTYLTAVSGGGLNALTSKYDTSQTASITWNSNGTPTRSDLAMVYKKGQTCQLIFWNVSWANEITTDTAVGTIPAGFRPPEKTFFYGYNRLDQLCKGWLGTDGVIRISKFPGELMYVSCTYLATY